MPSTIYKNNAAGQLNAGILATDTSILLTAGGGAAFPAVPAGDWFYATLIHSVSFAVEIVKVTARAADTLTVVRAQDNTTAIAFTAGSVVEMRLVAQMLREVDYRTQRGVANGLASLDAGVKVPAAQIPDLSATYLTVALRAAVNGVASLDGTTKIPVAQIPDLSGTYVTVASKGAANGVAPLDAGGLILDTDLSANIPRKNAAAAFTSTLTAAGITSSADLRTQSATATRGRLYFGDANTDYLDWDNTKFVLSQAISITGTSTATNHISTSDRRKKAALKQRLADPTLADKIALFDWLWKHDGQFGTGPIAQDVKKYAGHYVIKDDHNFLGVDKAGLALEAIVGLAQRVGALEQGNPHAHSADHRKRARVPRARATGR